MKTADAINHFGSQSALARALGIQPPSVAEWGERVPWRRQLEIERLTNGALKHRPADIPDDLRPLLSGKAAAA